MINRLHSPRMLRVIAGFTLIETMIAVAIIGVLAMIAYPIYTEHVAKSRRADARAALLEAAQWMERRYTMTNTYLNATPPAVTGATATFYTRRLATGADAPTATTFMLEMVPQGAMATDKCGTFRLNQAGAKTVAGTSAGATAATCWNQ